MSEREPGSEPGAIKKLVFGRKFWQDIDGYQSTARRFLKGCVAERGLSFKC
jgi:hypothetical protein